MQGAPKPASTLQGLSGDDMCEMRELHVVSGELREVKFIVSLIEIVFSS